MKLLFLTNIFSPTYDLPDNFFPFKYGFKTNRTRFFKELRILVDMHIINSLKLFPCHYDLSSILKLLHHPFTMLNNVITICSLQTGYNICSFKLHLKCNILNTRFFYANHIFYFYL